MIVREIRLKRNKTLGPSDSKLREGGQPHRKVYASKAWQQLAKEYKTDYPVCQKCQTKGRVKATEEVHHIIPLAEGGPALNKNNLMSCCKDCHRALHSDKRASESKYYKDCKQIKLLTDKIA